MEHLTPSWVGWPASSYIEPYHLPRFHCWTVPLFWTLSIFIHRGPSRVLSVNLNKKASTYNGSLSLSIRGGLPLWFDIMMIGITCHWTFYDMFACGVKDFEILNQYKSADFLFLPRLCISGLRGFEYISARHKWILLSPHVHKPKYEGFQMPHHPLYVCLTNHSRYLKQAFSSQRMCNTSWTFKIYLEASERRFGFVLEKIVWREIWTTNIALLEREPPES